MASRLRRRPDLPLVDFHGIVTVAPTMQALFERIERVARSDATVLIRGETGTGKELVARAIHELSPRAKGPMQAINCATLTPELLASELFGHVRGAFTGAVRDRAGLFALADRGTIFLDEIAEISHDVQARLLRVVQERNFVPLGATDPVSVDVRVVSATNKSLRAMVAEGRFREDLMYRLRVVPLFLPPLVERKGDVGALAWRFIDQFNEAGHRFIEAIDEDAWRALCRYPWPGNVRELRNAIEHAFAVGEGEILVAGDLPPELRGESWPRRENALAAVAGVAGAIVPPAGGMPPPSAQAPVQEERARIEEALRAAGGRRAEAARLLGISRSTLWRKMREHRLGPR